MPFLSVIMPMHNVESIVDRCLESLLSQDVDGLECVFVDDCSTDGTAAKIQRWIEANRSSNISFKLVRLPQNVGVASARNAGLDNAKGKYVYWADADDYLCPGALRTMCEAAKEYDADIVGCEWFLSFSQNERHMRQADAKSGMELFDTFAYGVSRWNLWLFMLRRSIIQENSLRFVAGDNMGEDLMLMSKAALLSQKVFIIHKPLYHYIQTNSSAITKNWSQETRRQVTANVENIEAFAKDFFCDKLENQLKCMKLNIKLPLLISNSTADYDLWQIWFPDSNKSIFKNPMLPLRTKLIQWAAKNKQYWILKAYNKFIFKFVYGILYK